MSKSDLDYQVVFGRSATKELERIDPPATEKILQRIESLIKNPRPPNCRKLAGSSNVWRIRVGDYRVVYSISDRDRLIVISLIRHRSKAYRNS